MKSAVIHEYEWIGTNPDSGYLVCLNAKQTNTLAAYEQKWAKGILEWGKDKVRFAGFCGTIKLGDKYLDILPKIVEEDNPHLDQMILIKMLQVVYDLQLFGGDATQTFMQTTTTLDVFIELFCGTIRAAARRGLPHSYTPQRDNLNILHGKLQVAYQVRHNACHPERLFCEYDEFQEDNTVNRVLKAALQIANRHAAAPLTRATVRSTLDLFIDVSDIPSSALQWAGIEQDRRFTTWRDALVQACWFLDGDCPTLHSGKNDSISLLFDMAKLFERYIAIEIRNLLSPLGYTVRIQGPITWLLSRQDKLRYKMVPDIHISKDDTSIAILDTKWKMPSNKQGETELAHSDLYQVFAYAHAHNVSKVALVYPRKEEKDLENDRWIFMDGVTELHILFADITLLTIGRERFRDQLYDSRFQELLLHVQ